MKLLETIFGKNENLFTSVNSMRLICQKCRPPLATVSVIYLLVVRKGAWFYMQIAAITLSICKCLNCLYEECFTAAAAADGVGKWVQLQEQITITMFHLSLSPIRALLYFLPRSILTRHVVGHLWDWSGLLIRFFPNNRHRISIESLITWIQSVRNLMHLSAWPFSLCFPNAGFLLPYHFLQVQCNTWHEPWLCTPNLSWRNFAGSTFYFHSVFPHNPSSF